MKRIIVLCLSAMLLASIACAQSLGDVAKKNRTQKPQKKTAPARVFTNEDLTATPDFNNGAASGVPAATEPGDTDKPDKSDSGSASSKTEDREKLLADWRARFDEQKKSIALLQREVDVTQREYKQQVALYYFDAGTRLRDQGAWAEQQRKYEADIATKQKDLDAARQKLEDMKEDARKAGVPSSVSD